MTTSDPTPAATVLVAIDIAKVRNEVLIEAPGHKRRRRLLVLNTRAEHDHLIEVLQAYGRPVVNRAPSGRQSIDAAAGTFVPSFLVCVGPHPPRRISLAQRASI